MSTFKRCDRCGTVIEPVATSLGQKLSAVLNNLVKEVIGEDVSDYHVISVDSRDGSFERILDLCPQCHDELVKWMKEAENEND